MTTENRGVSRARNHALAQASGEFVAFLDADDAWHPMKLERQLEAMTKRPSIGLCFTSADLVNGKMQKIGKDTASTYTDYSEALLIRGNIVSAGGSSVMTRRALVNGVGGFDPSLSQCADWDLWLRLSLETEFAAVSEPLVQYRKAPGSMSSDPALLERDTFALLDKFYDNPASTRYSQIRRSAYSNHWMICAGTYLHAGRPRDSLRCVRQGLRADPRSARRPLLLPARLASRVLKRRAHGKTTS
jgi:glycosyltransferase involved in cell wall biosynthesis